MRYEARVDGWNPISVNSLIGCNPHTANRRKRDAYQWVGFAVRAAGVPEATGRRRVSMVVGLTKGRAPDPDNIWKVVLDSLVQARRLLDDSQECVEQGTVEFVRGKGKFTVLIIEDI